MKQLLIVLLVSFAVFANLRVPDISQGDGIMVYTRFVNGGGTKISDASLRLYLHPADDFILAKNFDIKSDSDKQFITLYDRALEPGEYMLRATANHKDFRKKTRYTIFTVD